MEDGGKKSPDENVEADVDVEMGLDKEMGLDEKGGQVQVQAEMGATLPLSQPPL